ncbi:TPA: hypothetical protein ACH3X1_006682 [Trebouxia sp. C0004]
MWRIPGLQESSSPRKTTRTCSEGCSVDAPLAARFRRQASELSQQSLDSTSGSVLWPDAGHQTTNRLVPADFKSRLLAGSCASGVNLQLGSCQSKTSFVLAIFGRCLQHMFNPNASNHTQALPFLTFLMTNQPKR